MEAPEWAKNGRLFSANPNADCRLAFNASLYIDGLGANEGLLALNDKIHLLTLEDLKIETNIPWDIIHIPWVYSTVKGYYRQFIRVIHSKVQPNLKIILIIGQFPNSKS